MLRAAIDVFDLFARHQSRHGMPLFFGHNALLRREAVVRVGGLSPGIFADDIDLSIRLVRAGWRILYAPAIPFGETHPASYAGFRRRAYKWAFGCGQILRGPLLPALLDRRLSRSQKIGLLEFVGFYSVQVLLIAYLALTALALPWLPGAPPVGPLALMAGGLVVLTAIFLPAFAYFARRRELSGSWPFALVCAVVYGSVAFGSARGLIDGVLGRRRRWIPTNVAVHGAGAPAARTRVPVATWFEAGFGLLIFLVPALEAPWILWQPSLYLFSAVFLLAPFTAMLYVPDRPVVARSPAPAGRFRSRRRTWLVAIVAGALTAPFFLTIWTHASPPSEERVVVHGDRFSLDGAPFEVKGVHYSPWLPGTGPGKGYPWPSDDTVERDLGMIRDLGANTILVHDAPASIFAQARRHGLLVIYAYYINWQSIGDDATMRRRSDEIVRSAAGLAREPNLMAILLGNEVVEWVLKERGAPFIEGRLRSLRDAVHEAVPGVLIGHANWPIARGLDLSFMDFAAFNLYPSWPREVVVAGYGDYIQNTLKPIAAGRPLLITEFGQNTLEASNEAQARTLRQCWEEIRTHTAGGVVFSFADEWWKNYDNPIASGDWWQRQYAPDDEKTHDLDPEEYYGIVTSDRDPKPAYEAVREMFTAAHPAPAYRKAALCSLPLLLLVGYTLYVFRRPPGR
jgi:glycosyl transferase family 2